MRELKSYSKRFMKKYIRQYVGYVSDDGLPIRVYDFYKSPQYIVPTQKFNYPSNTRCRISFFGGEPTLLFDEIIIPITNYINK